jgi:hypothetical protein
MARTTSRKKVEKITHTCSRTGFTITGTPDKVAEYFYRDKSNASGFSPWSKDAEREYNRAYRAALNVADVARKADATKKGVEAFDATMKKEGARTPRKSAPKATKKVVATPKKKVAKKVVATSRKKSPVKVTHRKPQPRKRPVPVTAR